jgi:7-cyano-7-deazaguanine synthase
MPSPSNDLTTLVLASGGLDSSTLIALAISTGARPRSLFVDYGQPSAAAEERAASRVSTALGVELQIVRYLGSPFSHGEIPGRNAILVHLALMELRAAGTVMIGIHAGTSYVDCSPAFVEVMRRSFDFHSGGKLQLAVPFVEWTKKQIFQLACELGVPINETYSCEAGNIPCGSCLSCLDRRSLVAGDE